MAADYEGKFFDSVPPEMLLGGAKKTFYVWDEDIQGLLATEKDDTVFCVLSEGWCAMKGKGKEGAKVEWMRLAAWAMKEKDEGRKLRRAKWLAAGAGGKYDRHWSLDMAWHLKYVAWRMPEEYGALEVSRDARKAGVAGV